MNEIVVFYSNKCHTCQDHIKELDKKWKSEKICVDDFPELYEEYHLNVTPTTIVKKLDFEIWRCEGMMFDKQYEEMRRFL